jgi:PKD repeat protein
VFVDEAKSIPLLERLASEPVKEGRDTLQRWANISLELLRKPSITGHVRDTEGRPLKDVGILISGAENTNTATGHKGTYIVSRLNKGATYTITPEFSYYDNPGEIRYTLEPASKTISIVNRKVTGVDFIATRVRASKNVAPAREGAKVKASSAENDDFDIDDTLDEMRFAHVWGYGAGGWNDATPNVFPDWIEVDFAGVKRINWINVFTLPDNYKDAPEPDLEQTFSKYGITDFDVEYWTGRSWRTVPGGAIRGNRNVWRMISFPVIATNKIRIVVNSALGGASRITEIEAFHLNDLPQAKLISTKNARTKAAVQFRSDVSDRDGTIQHYELDFGDGTAPYEWHFDGPKAGPKPRLTHSHVYEKEGTYNVRLKVVDDGNEATETTNVVTVTVPPKRTGARALHKKSREVRVRGA